MLIEVIVQSVDDAIAASDGGADRLEVVRAIEDGGLTPPLDIVREIAAATSLPLRVMVRENAGYGTTATELALLRRRATELADLGVDGIVTGFTRGHEIAFDDLGAVLQAAHGTPATFHRAFDSLPDPLRALDQLLEVPGIDSILTDGGRGDAARRCEGLRRLAGRAAGRLRVVAGGGVDEDMFAAIVRRQCVDEVHVGRLARAGWDQRAPVSAARVRQLRRAADAEGGAQSQAGRT